MEDEWVATASGHIDDFRKTTLLLPQQEAATLNQ